MTATKSKLLLKTSGILNDARTGPSGPRRTMNTPELSQNAATDMIKKYNPTGRGFATGFGGINNHFGLIVDERKLAYIRLSLFGKTLIEYTNGDFAGDECFDDMDGAYDDEVSSDA